MPFAVLGLLLSAGLAGCGGGDTVQEALGYQRTGPDEMAVIKRPPLIVPPDFNLRPPRPGDENAAGRAASDAARQTLIGPSSSLEGDAAAPGEASDARALLTGSAPDANPSDSDIGDGDVSGSNLGASASAAVSEGQNLLVSRTNRAERNLDDLIESRDENRVDTALLRRLLAWNPEDRPAPADADDAALAENGATVEGETAEETPAVVQLVARSQTPIDAGSAPNPVSPE